MAEFVKGLDLSESFYREAVMPILDASFPGLLHTAGLIGYGSDVLGYDDEVSSDHMWGPRVYLFLRPADMGLEGAIRAALRRGLPKAHRGYSVHFGADAEGDGVRCMEPAPEEGSVAPLIWIQTIDGFLESYLGGRPQTNLDWLSMSEHRLLAFTEGRLFRDDLGMQAERDALAHFPRDVRLYLIASQWALIAEEQAFARRCGDRGDEIGSRLVCARIVERLGRLCFLLADRYAPYSKWFGTALAGLPLPDGLMGALSRALAAEGLDAREDALVEAQLMVAGMQNGSGVCGAVEVSVKGYYGRRIKVIGADGLCEAALEGMADEGMLRLPLVGTLSEVANFVALADEPRHRAAIADLYKALLYPRAARRESKG